MAEVTVLHAGGPVESCRSGDGSNGRSLPRQVSVFAPGVDRSCRSWGTLCAVSLDFSLSRLERLCEDGGGRRVRDLESRIGFTDLFLAGGAENLLDEVRQPRYRRASP